MVAKVDAASIEHFSHKLAVKQGMMQLMYKMVQLNARVLHQNWLKCFEEFGELLQNAVNWLHKVRKTNNLIKGYL